VWHPCTHDAHGERESNTKVVPKETKRLFEIAPATSIRDQIEFVDWWNKHVSIRYASNQHSEVNSRSALTREDAEKQTGITPQQVSRWRKHTADKAKYRERMILAAYRKADLVPPENHRAVPLGPALIGLPPVEAAEPANGARYHAPASTLPSEARTRRRPAARCYRPTHGPGLPLWVPLICG
jgi:hypothetical protein